MMQKPNSPGAAHRMRTDANRYRSPFWLSAANYYAFAAAVAVSLFFVILGVLHDGSSNLVWVAAAGAAFVMAVAVFIREVLMRNARERFLSAKRLDRSVRRFAGRRFEHGPPKKLTLESNEAILADIRKKSEAAKVLARLPEAHKEIVELCEKYLSMAGTELESARVGSPRIPAIRKGRAMAWDRHHFHMLKWAEIESRSLTGESASRDKAFTKLDKTQNALAVLDRALRSYPDEQSLVDSREVIHHILVSLRVNAHIDKAEKASFDGDHSAAVSFYERALADIRKSEKSGPDLQAAVIKIELEIKRSGKLKGGSERN